MNMKFLAATIISFCFIISLVNATSIDVKINPLLKGEINYFNYNISDTPVLFDIEFFNSGSFAYNTRIRLDIFNNDEKIFTGWSKKHNFFPGNTHTNKIYWYINEKGNFTIIPRVYFANEIVELDEINTEKQTTTETENIFDIKQVKVYDNTITFTLTSNQSARDIKIIPKKFVPGWIIEQETLISLEPNEMKKISLYYEPTVWSSRDIIIEIVSDDGKYYSEKTLKMRKQKSRLALFRELLLTYFLFMLV
ncbi:hypothetical protein ACFLQN_01435 [Candidatus Aenigmatarchaeota archaeon]